MANMTAPSRWPFGLGLTAWVVIVAVILSDLTAALYWR